MTSNDRRTRELAAVRDRILAAARELFAREGVESVTMRRIAEAIEYTPAALYTHFADKNDLLRTLCREDFGALTRLSLRLADIADPVQRVRTLGLMYVQFAVQHQSHYRFMFMTKHPEDLAPDAEDLARMNDPDEDGYAFLRVTIEAAMASGRFRVDVQDAELVAQMFWAGVHGVASLEITHSKDPWITWRPIGVRARLMVDNSLRGMLKDPSELERLPEPMVPEVLSGSTPTTGTES